ncbi:unnamed protein product [Auanema sp. JU1783]|nr:unnamed protein product [Auanema sp. JU1783]
MNSDIPRELHVKDVVTAMNRFLCYINFLRQLSLLCTMRYRAEYRRRHCIIVRSLDAYVTCCCSTIFFICCYYLSSRSDCRKRIFHLTLYLYVDDVQTTSEPQWAPTGRLSQFRGFITPRPQLLPENAQLMYASIWAAWSAWSFCSNGVQIRVRACNTVKGFSCLGANQETKPCENMITTPTDRVHHQPTSDYDVVDPWQADREEALKQLYPDDDEKKQEKEHQAPVPGSFKILSAGKTHQLEPPPYDRPSALGVITHELSDRRQTYDFDGAPGSTPERLFGAKQFAVKTNEHKERKHKGSGKLGSSEKSFEKEEHKNSFLNLVPMDEKSAEVAQAQHVLKTEDEVDLHSETQATTLVTSTSTTTTTVPTTTTSTTISSTSSTTPTVTTTLPPTTTSASPSTTSKSRVPESATKIVKLTRTDLENQRKAIGDRISKIFSAFDEKKVEHISGEASESLPDRSLENDRSTLFEADLKNAAKVKTFRVDEDATDPSERVEPKRKGFGFTEVTTTEGSPLLEVVPEDQISPDTLSVLDWMLKNMTKAASELPVLSENVQKPSTLLSSTNGALIAEDGDVEPIVAVVPVVPIREDLSEVSAEAAHPKKHLPKRKIRKLKKSRKNVERDTVLHLGDYSPINPDPLKMFPKFKAKPVEQARARALGVRTFHSDKDANDNHSTEKFPSDTESVALMNEINQLQKLMKDMDEKIDDLNQQQEGSMDIRQGDFGLPVVQGSEIFQAGTEAPIKFFDEGVSEGDNEGKWTDWSEWGVCFCGKQVRTRICSYTQASTGCRGSSHESRDCAGGFCPRAAKKTSLSTTLTETPSNQITPSSQHSFKPIRLQQAAHLLP